MRVALVCPYSWTTPGGVAHHIENLAAQLRQRGHEVSIIAPADGPVPAGVQPVGRSIGVPYNGSIARLAIGPRAWARVRSVLAGARPDVVHVHEPFAPSVGLLALVSAGAPCVATFHANAPESRAYKLVAGAFRPLWRKLAVRIAVSDEARATVERVFGPGVRVVPNGIDLERFAEVPALDPDAKTVLFVGRLERRKGCRVLIEAFGRVASAVPGARLLIVGEGGDRAACEAAVAPHARRAVSFLGRVASGDLASAMGRASVVAAPSLGGESFGIVLLEAMASGRPVVASDIAGYATVARHGVEALLVPPGDATSLAGALQRVMSSPGLAAGLAGAGRKRAAEFDWRRVAESIEGCYRDALQVR